MKFHLMIFAAILMFAAASFNGQNSSANAEKRTESDEGVYLFKTQKGYLYVFNFEKDAYQLELKGEKLEYADKHIALAFFLDDKFINLLFVLNENFWTKNSKAKNEATENELLEAHKTWESDFFSDRYKTRLAVSSEIFNLESGRKVMFWSFSKPRQADSDAALRHYLTTPVGKNIVGIAADSKSAADEKELRNYLAETMNTLKVSDKPFNIEELRRLYKELEFGEDNL